MKMLKRLIFCLVVAAPLMLVAGCIYDRHTQQFSFATHTRSSVEGANFRELAMGFAKGNGFTKEIRAGNSAYLEKEGMYVISFIARDESYISINNVGNKDCYSVGIYSAGGDAAASAIGQALIQLLNKKKIGDEMIASQSRCN